ncbi:MAG: SphA family protein [Armatimonadota bacterium]
MLKTRAALLGLTAILALVIVDNLHASESGQSTYPPGFQDTLAGYLPPPGSYFKQLFYFYNGNASKVVGEGNIKIDLHENLPVQFSIFNQVTKRQLYGSFYSWAVIVPFAEPKLTGQVVTPSGDIQRSQSVSGLSEIEVIPIMLGWHNGRSHQKAWLTIYAPTGEYNLDNFVNTSLNRWAVELDYAYTFLDIKTGYEFDVAPGYTFNFQNPATDYTSGQEFHVDFAGLKHYSPSFSVGAVGYAFIQATADSGSGAELGAFEGRTFALGPIVNYNTNVGSVPIALTGKYYGEYGVSKRFAGHSYWLNVNASF